MHACVLVLRGGISDEREVSLRSGMAVAEACRRLGHIVVESDISPSDLSAIDIPADVVFPVLHGRFGEDGELQSILERRGLNFVGSDAVSSEIAMDKVASKTRWTESGLPTAPWFYVESIGGIREFDTRTHAWFVKPVREGSSIGIKCCDNEIELARAVEEGVKKFGRVMVEPRLQGRELTVGILGSMALPIVQIKAADGVFDYEAKYQRADTKYLLCPEIDTQTYQAAQNLAIDAFRVTGCRDLARVDMIDDEQRGLQLLEINTIPGFTNRSLYPMAAAHAGIPFDALVSQLLLFARGR